MSAHCILLPTKLTDPAPKQETRIQADPSVPHGKQARTHARAHVVGAGGECGHLGPTSNLKKCEKSWVEMSGSRGESCLRCVGDSCFFLQPLIPVPVSSSTMNKRIGHDPSNIHLLRFGTVIGFDPDHNPSSVLLFI